MCHESYIKRGYSKHLTTYAAPKLAIVLEQICGGPMLARSKSLLLDLGEAQELLEKPSVCQCTREVWLKMNQEEGQRV